MNAWDFFLEYLRKPFAPGETPYLPSPCCMGEPFPHEYDGDEDSLCVHEHLNHLLSGGELPVSWHEWIAYSADPRWIGLVVKSLARLP